jgi:intein/homing endonuclease
MLDRSFSFDPPSELFAKRDPYELVLKQDAGWTESKRRILIVVQSVDGRDLKAGELLGVPDTERAFINAVKYSRKIAQAYQKDKPLIQGAITCVNFNAFRHLHMSTAQKRESEIAFADRIHKLIRKIKPTHILFSGDEAMHATFPKIEHPQYKRGWVHDLELGDLKLKVTSTLDFFRLLEKQGEQANLLGFWCRHFAHLMIGRNPHDLSATKSQPRYIRTLEDFDKLMGRLAVAEVCAVDTETRNLSVLFNKLYTIQFCTNQNEEVGYVVAIDHPLAHWSKEERLHIKKGLRRFFSAKKGPLLVTFNGMFDLRVIRQQLKIPIIWHRVWEITFGEHALDENVSALNKVTSIRDTQMDDSSKFGGLRPILCSYGNDFYFQKSSFGKAERAQTGTTDPTNKDFLKYAAMDAVSLLQLRKQQISRASFIDIAGRNFKPFFVRHMLYQMSDTAHQLSHLRNDGSKIQKSYLKHLLSSDGPLRKELKRAAGEFKVYKEVKQANAELLKESGFKAGSLWGSVKAASNWMFKLTRTPHKAKLFFDILGLQALSQTKTGADAIDKAFVAHYKDKNKIIGLYGEYQALSKLMSTYVRGWFKRLSTNLDAAKDHHLRPDYSVWGVVTGRLASMGPNLQQIPSRGKLAKIIKRMFISSKGYLLIRYDYCVTGDALIPTTEGLVRLDEMQTRIDKVRIGGAKKAVRATKWTSSGRKPVLRVTAKSGNHVTCTDNHEIMVLRDERLQWVRADECVPGDYMCLNSRPVVRSKRLPLSLSDAQVMNDNNSSGHTNVYRMCRASTFYVKIKDGAGYHRKGGFRTLEDAVAYRDDYNRENGFALNRSFIPLTNPKYMTPDLAFILGCIIAEGHFTTHNRHNTVHFTNSDPALIKRYTECVKRVFNTDASVYRHKIKGQVRVIDGVVFKTNHDHYQVRTKSNQMVQWLIELGLYHQQGRKDGKTPSHYKVIPWSILQADEQSQLAFLAAYLECDGTVYNQGNLVWYSASDELIDGIRSILNAHGYITAGARTRTVREIRMSRAGSNDIWPKLKPYMVTKQFTPIELTDGTEYKQLGYLPLSLQKSMGPDYLRYLDGLGLWFTPIVSIERAGTREVYDLTMEKGAVPAFIANGLIVHNCAHEVRIWSVVSGDKVMADTFKVGQKLRQEFIQNPTEENKKAIKEKGDVHILNVLRFFGKLVDKDHPLRDAVKAIIFGVLYGKGAETLGIDTKKSDMDSLKGKISALYDESLTPSLAPKRLAEINAMLEELDTKLSALIAEDRTDYAQSIIDKMFNEFKAGAAWTQRMGDSAENDYYVYSPIGRRRFLPAAMTGDRAIVAQQVRRGSNAPVQGFASEIGIKASRLIMEAYYKNLKTFKDKLGIEKSDWDMRVFFSRVVHDANYFAIPYDMVVPFMHILQYQATYGVTQAYEDEFNVKFTVEPEVEIEVAGQDDSSYKIDWSLPSFVECIKKAVADCDKLGVLEGTQDEVLNRVLQPWRNPDMRKFLQDKFPLLGVKDLDRQIRDAVKPEVKEKVEV